MTESKLPAIDALREMGAFSSEGCSSLKLDIELFPHLKSESAVSQVVNPKFLRVQSDPDRLDRLETMLRLLCEHFNVTVDGASEVRK